MLCRMLALALVRLLTFCSASVCDSWVSWLMNWAGSVGESGSWFWIWATSSLVNIWLVSLPLVSGLVPPVWDGDVLGKKLVCMA